MDLISFGKNQIHVFSSSPRALGVFKANLTFSGNTAVLFSRMGIQHSDDLWFAGGHFEKVSLVKLAVAQ